MDSRGYRKGLSILFVGYAFYAGLYIFRTSFVIDGTRYFCLFDDAMISMRYAKNFAHGYGLVWNPGGEHVEGFTNLLWVLYMAFFHVLHIPEAKISLMIQASNAAFLLLNLGVVSNLALRSTGSFVGALSAACLTAVYLPLNTWSLQGMEVGILTLIVTTSIWLTARQRPDSKRSLSSYWLLGIGTLVRIDLVVPYVALMAYEAVFHKKDRFKFLLYSGLILAFFVGIQTGFRLWYYGAFLPNTYYLKMTGFPALYRITRGFTVLMNFIWSLNWILFALPFVVLIYRPQFLSGLVAWVVSAQMAYSVYVGGDAWEWWGGSNRFLCPVMPIFFVFFVWAGQESYAALHHRLENPLRISSRLHWAVLAVCAFNFNAISGPLSWAEWMLLKQPIYASNNKRMTELGRLLDRITQPDARIAVVWAGIAPYFSERYFIDMLGKNDPEIAREPMHRYPDQSKYINFYPGHMKWNYAYTIGQLKPDIVVQLWRDPEEARPYMSHYEKTQISGFELYIRKDTAKVTVPSKPST